MAKNLEAPALAREPGWQWRARTPFLQRVAPAWSSRDYRVFWLSQFAVNLAWYMHVVTRGWVVFELSDSAAAVGAVSFAIGLPMFLLGPLGGVVADRGYKRPALITTQTTNVLLTLGLGLLIASGSIEVWHFAVIGAIQGTLWAFSNASVQVTIADILGERHLGNGIGLMMVAWSVGAIVGPLAAGFLIGYDPLGAKASYYIMSALFTVSVLLLSRVPDRGASAARSRTGVTRDLAEGLRYAWASPTIITLIGLLFAVTLFGMPYVVLLPVLADNVFDVGSQGLGYLNTAAGVGSVLGAFLVAGISGSRRVRWYLLAFGVGMGASLVLLGSSGTFALALLAVLLAGAASMAYLSLTNVLLFRAAEPEKYGRVNSLSQMTFGVFPVASLPTGAVADALGIQSTISGAGALVIAVITLGAVRLARTPMQRRPLGVEPGG